MANRKIILDYLTALQAHNDREWFHAHKEEYQGAKEEFEDLIQQVIGALGETDSGILHLQPKELTFKLMRDTRFSKDKSPYNPAMRAHISSQGKLPVPVGYYLMIKPGDQSFLGGGLFADMFKDATAMVRDYLVQQGEEWEQVITAPRFRQYFTVQGTKLKNVPRGYEGDHPQSEYLKHKSWYLEYPLTDAQFLADDFLTLAREVFEAMRPFNAYLNRALAGFTMPQRPQT